MAPLALYVHVPWCVRKCPYCDFNSHHLRGELPAAPYVDALLADLREELRRLPEGPRELVSIFIGGGTPSLLPAAEVGRLLDGVAALVHLPGNAEITLEANPGTVERHAFAAFREAGVNRVSLGVQSFDGQHLRRLGRIHDPAQARTAIDEALRAMPRVNLDLMYGLPDQTLEACLRDLRTAIACGPEHLSHYELTIEPGTVFARYVPTGLPDDDLSATMREACLSELAAAGYDAYEISAHARAAAARSRHNLNYWEYGDYLGIGAGAHSKLSLPAADAGAGRSAACALHILRWSKVRSPRAYLTAGASPARIAHEESVPPDARSGEFMLNALRLADGFTEALFEARTGLAAEIVRPRLRQLAHEGLMRFEAPDTWRPTALGRAFTNDLQAHFIN